MRRPYRNMSVPELEIQYNARATVSDFDAEMRVYRALSDEAYADLTFIQDIPYGPNPDERIDLFPTRNADSPLLVFIHGGYWRALGRQDSAFMAKSFVSNGVAVAILEYTLAPSATLDQIVDQTRRATAHLIENTQNHPFDQQRIYLAGSSAGAHLAAMALRPEIKGAVLASGLYDLEPLRFCAPNEWLALTETSARTNSPMHQPTPSDTPLIFTWGDSETAEFKRQSQAFARKTSDAGNPVTQFVVPDRNHFSVITDLSDTQSRLFNAAINMIRAQHS